MISRRTRHTTAVPKAALRVATAHRRRNVGILAETVMDAEATPALRTDEVPSAREKIERIEASHNLRKLARLIWRPTMKVGLRPVLVDGYQVSLTETQTACRPIPTVVLW